MMRRRTSPASTTAMTITRRLIAVINHLRKNSQGSIFCAEGAPCLRYLSTLCSVGSGCAVTHDIESCDCGHPVNRHHGRSLFGKAERLPCVLMGYAIMNTCVPLSRSCSTVLGFRSLL